MTELRSGKRVGRRWSKRLGGVLLALVVAGSVLTGAVAGWHWLRRLRWIEGNLDHGLTVARKEHRQVLLLLSADW